MDHLAAANRASGAIKVVLGAVKDSAAAKAIYPTAAGQGHGHDGWVVFDAAGVPFAGFCADVPHGSEPAAVGALHRGCVVVVVPVLAVRRPVPAISRGIGVANVQPRRAVIGQHPAHLVESHHDALDVFSQGIVAADLPLDRVIPKRPVRRRRHHRLHAPIWQQPKRVNGRTANQYRAI